MAELNRDVLLDRLNNLSYRSIEGAWDFCRKRGNPYVELVHWIHQMLDQQDSDFHLCLEHFRVDWGRLGTGITNSLDRLPRGSTAMVSISSHILEAIERGWVIGSLMFGEGRIRTGHLLVGILDTPRLRQVLLDISDEFTAIKLETLTRDFHQILKSSGEELSRTDLGSSDAGTVGGAAPTEPGRQEALNKFSVDLTERVRKGEIDPIVGRDNEIRQIVDILMRRRQNNPILTGEAGVGKTAVVEGFAHRIVAGDVPPSLKDVTIRILDVGSLQAGASMRGEFEQRLRQVIEEVQASPKPIILFIDEAHTLIGAGGAAGTGDAANLLKPALARGTLRTVAATTWAEYKKYFEKDPALTRRFQVVQVDEPGEENCILMMRSLASTLEKHHRVQLLDEALESAVRLSKRYIPARQLPDKAVSLLDTACARVAISQHAVPAEVDDSRRRIEGLDTELEIIARERAVGLDIKNREKDASAKRAAENDRLAGLETRWKGERGIVDRILDLRSRLRGDVGKVEGTQSDLEKKADAAAKDINVAKAGGEQSTEGLPSDAERETMLQQLKELQKQLDGLQGERPLILPSVDDRVVASVVKDWTGIPVSRMMKNEIETVLALSDALEKRVIGQRHALDAISKRIRTTRARLDNPNKPIGVFLLSGPSGVGKTETALALAETLYGGEQNLIAINMSEFQEAHTVSTLKGAPPGYVGYGEGGVLTEAVRRKPYSVVLLDEVEKAHPDVHEIFFQVFDKGWMEDGEGRYIDFKNTLIILTSNVGTDLILKLCKDPELQPDADGIARALREPLLKVFPAALLGRLIVIPYYPLSDEVMGNIARLQLGRIKNRVSAQHNVAFNYGDEVVKLIVDRCTEVDSGGRLIDAILTNTVLPRMSEEFLKRILLEKPVSRVTISVDGSDFGYAFE